LKRLKYKVYTGEIGIGLAYGFLCGIAGSLLCAGGGPAAAGCGIAGGLICSIAFGLLTRTSLEEVINDIHWTMDKLGCSCAIYC
jgi:hypothetical protein